MKISNCGSLISLLLSKPIMKGLITVNTSSFFEDGALQNHCAQGTLPSVLMTLCKPSLFWWCLLVQLKARKTNSQVLVSHKMQPVRCYSLDLLASSFYLFDPIKDSLPGQGDDTDKVEVAVRKRDLEFFQRGIKGWIQQWCKGFACGGDYDKWFLCMASIFNLNSLHQLKNNFHFSITFSIIFKETRQWE